MRITLAQLEAFYWVAKLGKFQDAGRHLHLAQPTISLRIRDLEAELGVSLFDRAGRNARLTSDGTVLFDLSATILADLQKIYERLGSPGAVQGTLTAGMPENFALVCLPEFLRTLERDYPKLRVEVADGTSARLASELSERRIDVAIVTNPPAIHGINLIPLGSHPMAWAAGRGIDVRATITPDDVRTLPIISNPEPEPQHRMILDWFNTAGLSPTSLSTCTSVAVIAELVASGVGLSLLPYSFLQPMANDGKIRILKSDPPVQPAHIFCAFHATGAGANIDAFLRIIREVASNTSFTV